MNKWNYCSIYSWAHLWRQDHQSIYKCLEMVHHLKNLLKTYFVVIVFYPSSPVERGLEGQFDRWAFGSVMDWPKCSPTKLSFKASIYSTTCVGFVRRTRTVRSVVTCAQVKRCVVSCTYVLQRGHTGDGLYEALILYKYDRRNGDLFVRSWARVRRRG